MPFQQAIPQSPGFKPITTNELQEQIFNSFLSYANVSTLQDARNLPTETLIQANTLQIFNADYGEYVYGPTVDGDFVPALPGLLLLHGQYDKSLRVMAGHNADEGLAFTSPFIINETDYEEYFANEFPAIQPSVEDYITQDLYPPAPNETLGYEDQIQRTAFSVSELIFTCNTYYMASAYAAFNNGSAYSYRFDVPPALHGEDVAYTFYDAPNGTVVIDGYGVPVNETVAYALQDFITSFVRTGAPSSTLASAAFPEYGTEGNIMTLDVSGIVPGIDDSDNYRCRFWQKALYS